MDYLVYKIWKYSRKNSFWDILKKLKKEGIIIDKYVLLRRIKHFK